MQPLSKDEVDRIVDNNLVEEFDKLAATPGFVLAPMPFRQVGARRSRSPQQCLTHLSLFGDQMWDYYVLCHLCLYKQDLTTSQQDVCLQDFPYYVEEGISHDNIWSTTPLSTEQLVQVIERQLGPTRQYTYFVNPGPLASIPGVWHAHCMHTAN